MAASAATSMFLHVPSSSSSLDSSGKTIGKIRADTIDARRISSVVKSKPASPGKLQFKAIGTKLGVMECLKTDDEATVPPKGRLVQDGLVFRQNFRIRSYEIGPDRTASVETLMNHMQETALNHSRSVGLLNDGFGSSPEMSRRNLIWVVTKMNILVDRYPTWGDVVEVDTWVAASGKNGMRRDWLLRDSSTGDILTRAKSVWVMMNKETRRLSKIPKEAREEIHVCFRDCPPILEQEEEDNRKLPQLDDSNAHYICNGLTPKRSDLDVNQHVNNVKYVGWLLESAPSSIVETHELARITLEYRRECRRDSVLRSLSRVVDDGSNQGLVECQHLLRLEGEGGGGGGGEVVKGRTTWRAKQSVEL